MPLVEASLVEGRGSAQIRGLLHAVRRAVEESLGSPREDIRVMVREIPTRTGRRVMSPWPNGAVMLDRRSQATPIS